ncbi:MAG: sigma-70 family RNA polymerase sigma factor [Myxococcota bacterium]
MRLDTRACAVSTAYARYARFVRDALVRCGVPPSDAPDLAHEVFVVLLRRVGDHRAPKAMRSWLFQTARRLASNYRRGQRRTRARFAKLGEAMPEASPEDRVAHDEAATFIGRFLDDLEPDARALFLLSEVEGVRGTEIANRLELNRKTAYSRVYALRRRFERAAARQFGAASWARGAHA